jgi:hypothetical protein
MKDADIVGHTLAEVLPHNPKYWFQTPHLLRLNLLLLVPLLSSSVAGYDGMFNYPHFPKPKLTMSRLSHEWTSSTPTMAKLL